MNGNRPLHIASQNGHYAIVKQLIDLGVDLNAQNNSGNTALHMAKRTTTFGSLATSSSPERTRASL